MNKTTVLAPNKKEAKKKCEKEFGWKPQVIQRLPPAERESNTYRLFESEQDARRWTQTS